MEFEKVKGWLVLSVVLAVALPGLIMVVWIVTHISRETLNFLAGAVLVGLPAMLILGGVVFAQLNYMAKDRRADTVERMGQTPPQVVMLPPQQVNGYGPQGQYQYRAVLPHMVDGSDEVPVSGVIMGERDNR